MTHQSNPTKKQIQSKTIHTKHLFNPTIVASCLTTNLLFEQIFCCFWPSQAKPPMSPIPTSFHTTSPCSIQVLANHLYSGRIYISSCDSSIQIKKNIKIKHLKSNMTVTKNQHNKDHIQTNLTNFRVRS